MKGSISGAIIKQLENPSGVTQKEAIEILTKLSERGSSCLPDSNFFFTCSRSRIPGSNERQRGHCESGWQAGE